jgi:hypothetical protein
MHNRKLLLNILNYIFELSCINHKIQSFHMFDITNTNLAKYCDYNKQLVHSDLYRTDDEVTE